MKNDDEDMIIPYISDEATIPKTLASPTKAALPSHLTERSLNITWSIYPIGTGALYVFKHGGYLSIAG